MLYTVIDPADLFYTAPPQRKVIKQGKLMLEGTEGQNGFTVCRLITTDLNEYVHGSVIPGQVLTIQKKIDEIKD